MTTWVALLRGINVGGKNTIAMQDLRASVAGLDYGDVASYIQSGNLLFDASDTEASIVANLRDLLVGRHELDVPVVVRTLDEIELVVGRHPDAESGIDPKLLHVAFLDRAPEADAVAALEHDAWAPDRWSVEGRELFLTYPDGSGRSKMTIDRFERPWSIVATARNLNTVRKLVELGRSR